MSLFASMNDDNSVWSKGSSLFNISSPLNDLLESDTFTLDQILQEDELIQEVKTRNTKLLEFMSQEEVVNQLVHYVVDTPEDTSNDLRTLKYPYMACEVICCDISSITETLACAQDGKIIEALFHFLYTSIPLDPRLAGYFEKIMSMLMVRKPQEMTTLMNKHAQILLQAFMNHVHSYSIAELLKRLLQPYHNDYMDDMMDFPGMSLHGSSSSTSWYGPGPDEDEVSVGTPTSNKKTLVWQQDTTVIDLLLTNLQSTQVDGDAYKHSADILIDIIHCGTRAQTNGEGSSTQTTSMVLLEYLETKEIVQQLLDLAIPMETSSSLSTTSALSVLSALLARHTNVRYITVEIVPPTIGCILERIPQLCATLQAKDEVYGMILNQRHQSIPRLSLHRLKLVGLIGLLVQTKYTQVDTILLSQHVLEICLDLFFKFESVNMLHAEIENMVIGILENGGNDLLTALIKQSRLLSRILIAHEENDGLNNGFSLGYMGHLHHICYTIIRLIEDVEGGEDGNKTEKNERTLHEMTHADTVLEMLEEDQEVWKEWESLVSRVLKPMYERECQPLGGDSSKSVNGEDPYTILGNSSAMNAMNEKFAEMLNSQFDLKEDFVDDKSIMMPELMQDSSSDEDDEESHVSREDEGVFDPRGSSVKRWQNVEASEEDGSQWANFEQAANAFASFDDGSNVEAPPSYSFASFDDIPTTVMDFGIEEPFTADFSQIEETVVPPAPVAVETRATEEES